MGIIIPEKFKKRYRRITDTEEMLKSLNSFMPACFRVNTLKTRVETVLEKFLAYGITFDPVQWMDNAFHVDDANAREAIEHFMGHIYFQDAASMLPATLIPQSRLKGRILDACAAPGDKATQIATLMGNQGAMIANDSNESALKRLRHNVESMGITNTIITDYDFRYFPRTEIFDSVVLDPPCSGEGELRTDSRVLEKWSEYTIKRLSVIQKTMIVNAFHLVKFGGTLIYCTSTFAPEENEEVVQHLLHSVRGAKLMKISFNEVECDPGLPYWRGRDYDGDMVRCVRIWPHYNDTGGLFVAEVKRT